MSLVERLLRKWKWNRKPAHRAAAPRRRLEVEGLERRELLSASSLRLDFGSPSSAVAAGHTGVPLAAYDAATGYGWEDTAGLAVRDRGIADALARDFHFGRDGTFLADLADGSYRVTATVGDAWYAHEAVAIFAQGRRVVSGVSTASGEFRQVAFDVTVQGGRLDLRFLDEGGRDPYFVLNGLDITPITDDPPPTAGAGPDRSSAEGATITFGGSASGGGLSYRWDFGDGNTASGTLSPTHTYADDGAYIVTLTVTDGLGRTATDTAAVTVGNVAPVASHGGPYTGTADVAINFAGSATDPSSADTAAGFNYRWEFGDGATSTQRNPGHTYAAAGTYAVRLTVTDKDGGQSTASTTAVIGEQSPNNPASLRLDFGSSSSAVAAGHTGVPLAAYDAATGYGWEDTAGLAVRDRGIADALARDFHFGRDGTFLADLADGSYRVTATVGDAWYAHEAVAIFAQGQRVASGVSTASGEFRQVAFDVTVQGGRLRLRFLDEGGRDPYFVLNGLDITPITDDTGRTLYVSAAGSDSGDGSSASPWRTLQHAADSVRAGDTVIVRAGTYAGFDLWTDGAADKPITFRAEAGAIVNDRNARTADAINLEGADHIVIDGFTIVNPTGAIARAGVRSVLNHHVTVRDNNIDSMGRWGIFTGFTDDVLIENNVTSRSAGEHGIYVSNSGDRPVIRGNTVWGNYAAGIHMNGDLSQGGDGIISAALVEDNVIYDNGRGGGSGINADGVQDSLFRNNLLYNNHASGISLYRTNAAEGSKDNVVVNNTVLVAADGRWALNVQSGSTGNTVRNNIFYSFHSYRGAIDVSADSLAGFTSDYNVVESRFTTDGGDSVRTLSQWQAATGQDLHSVAALPAALFVSLSLNDYHLRVGSAAIDAGTSPHAPARDIEGTARPLGAAVDVGAYEYKP